MKINKVLDWYYRSYYAAANNREEGRSPANAVKAALGTGSSYMRAKAALFSLFSGRFYWPNTHPTGVDKPTAEFLYSLVRMHNPRTCLEIGTAKGNSAIAIGQALEDNGGGTLLTLDPERQVIVPIAIRRAGLENRIRYWNYTSYEWIQKFGNAFNFDFVFIDGDHSYENVKRDWELVEQNISGNAVVVFHDTVMFDGPKRVVAEIDGERFDRMTFVTENGAGISIVKSKVAEWGMRGIWER